MSAPRFDIIYGKDGVYIDYHFCRLWDDGVGCYGTNPNHGYSFEEARDEMIQYHLDWAQRWKNATYEEWCSTGALLADRSDPCQP